MSVNRWTGLGRLTRDPEIRYAQSGLEVGNFCIATNFKWKGKDGEQKEEVHFQECTIFGKAAEFLGQKARKGDQLYVEGRLKTEEWEDKQTHQTRRAVKVICDRVELAGQSLANQVGGNSAGGSAPAPTQQQRKAASDNDGGAGHGADANDDVPF